MESFQQTKKNPKEFSRNLNLENKEQLTITATGAETFKKRTDRHREKGDSEKIKKPRERKIITSILNK